MHCHNNWLTVSLVSNVPSIAADLLLHSFKYALLAEHGNKLTSPHNNIPTFNFLTGAPLVSVAAPDTDFYFYIPMCMCAVYLCVVFLISHQKSPLYVWLTAHRQHLHIHHFSAGDVTPCETASDEWNAVTFCHIYTDGSRGAVSPLSHLAQCLAV